MVRHTLKILKQPVYLRIIKIDTEWWPTACLHCQNLSIRTNNLCCSASFGQVFIFCRLLKESMLEWFLLIMVAAYLVLGETLKFQTKIIGDGGPEQKIKFEGS